jgi:hypothetical protein
MVVRSNYALFRWSEVSHNLSRKLCPIYLSLDKIRDMRIGYARVSTVIGLGISEPKWMLVFGQNLILRG